jgi:DNA polymerase-3 subunit delta
MARSKPSRTSPGYNELRAELRAGTWRRLYVLSGEETFLVEHLLEALTETLVSAGSRMLDRVLLDGNNRRLSPGQIEAEVMTPPFLSRCKLVIVRQSGWFAAAGRSRSGADDEDSGQDEAETAAAGGARDRQAVLAALFARLPDSACLVFVEQKVDRRIRSLVQAIEQNGVLAEFSREQPRTLQRWIEGECKRRSLTIEPIAAESLIDRCEGSMQLIWQELTKLFLYCDNTGQNRIDRQLVEDLSLPDLHGSIFDMTDAISDGRTGRALELLDVLVSQKQPVQLIQFMLTRHFRQLICAAELGRPDAIQGALKVPPFVASRLSQQARRLSPLLLEQLYAACFESDIRIKSGQIGDRLGLETLLAESAGAIAAARGH